jgi:hypothetical protein
MKKGVVDRPSKSGDLPINYREIILLIAQFAHIPFRPQVRLFASLGVCRQVTVDLAWLS